MKTEHRKKQIKFVSEEMKGLLLLLYQLPHLLKLKAGTLNLKEEQMIQNTTKNLYCKNFYVLILQYLSFAVYSESRSKENKNWSIS